MNNKENILKLLFMVGCLSMLMPCVTYAQSSGNIDKQSPQKVYIAHDHFVTVLDYNTFGKISEKFARFALAASEKELYEIGSITIGRYDIKTLNELESIDYDGEPAPRNVRAAITPDGKKMYVGAPGWNGHNALSAVLVIDIVKRKQLKILEKDKVYSGLIGMSRDGKYVYLAGSGVLTVINTANDSIYKKITIAKSEQIQDMVTGENNTIYLVTYRYEVGSSKDYKFRVIDLNKGVLKTMDIAPEEYKDFRLLLNSGGRYLYIIGNEKIIKFDTATNNVIMEKDFKYWPEGAAISPDGKFLFVQALKENKVVVYDIGKESVMKEITFNKDLYDILVK